MKPSDALTKGMSRARGQIAFRLYYKDRASAVGLIVLGVYYRVNWTLCHLMLREVFPELKQEVPKHVLVSLGLIRSRCWFSLLIYLNDVEKWPVKRLINLLQENEL